MRTVYIPDQIANVYTKGVRKLTDPGNKIDQIVASLDKQYPGIKNALSDGFACALGNEIIHDWFDEELENTKVIRFIPAIEGG